MTRHSYTLTLQEGPARPLVAAWLMLAVTALGVSALYAAVLVAARVPYVSRWLPNGDVFHGALALHVALAALVWFLAFAAALWNAVSGSAALRLRWAGFGLGLVGGAAIAAAPLAGGGTALPSNYLPVLDNTAFLSGLGWFVAGVALTALPAARPRAAPLGGAAALHIAISVALVPALLAGVSGAWSVAAAPEGLAVADFFEIVFWGPGHVLQFTHVTLMMVAWLALAAQCGITLPLAPRAVVALAAAGAAPALAAPVIHLIRPVATPEFRAAFTLLMSYGSWIVAAVLGGLLLFELARRRSDATAPGASLALSIVLFLAGCAAGAAIRGDTVLVPAHYHGTIGAVTLAYMALAVQLMRQLGWRGDDVWLARSQVLYGAGLALLVLGLAWSGSHSLPRKTAWTGGGGVEVLIAMGLAGAGGAVAIVSAAAFALLAWRAAWRRRDMTNEAAPLGGQRRPTAARRRDSRPRAVALTLVAVVSGGIALAWVGDGLYRPAVQSAATRDPRVVPAAHAAASRAAEVEQRFKQGVVMLHAKQYDHAITAFHRVLELAPELPEAHVNMGFALIGVKRYGAARDFFESATALRASQVNAYYGLAVALEGVADLPGAVGAMRTFVHLAKADDPYLRKAQAALWEWEEALARDEHRVAATEGARGAEARPAAAGITRAPGKR